MRLRFDRSILFVVVLAAGGCAPEVLGPSGSGALDMVAGLSVTNPGAGDSGTASPSAPKGQAAAPVAVLTGSVSQRGDYQLFELAGGIAGEQWTISEPGFSFGSAFLVVLFDAEYELLQRQRISASTPLRHIVRRGTPTLYLGVTPDYGGGGSFRFEVYQYAGVAVAAPRQQVVWVDFGPGADVVVHGRGAISFPAFDAAALGAEYAGQTETIKDAVVTAMRSDYAAYNVVILTSDDGPPPAGPHATLHIGGNDSRLLGLADNVDQYNVDPWQTAIVYAEGFADFAVMRLSVEEMGQMIGNTASHEVGHLLGLFHTQSPVDLMDMTGTAWDLVADQSFTRGPLETTVFPFGFENSPERLAEIVGTRPGAEHNAQVKPPLTQKALRKAALRAILRDELRCRCGNCLSPDE